MQHVLGDAPERRWTHVLTLTPRRAVPLKDGPGAPRVAFWTEKKLASNALDGLQRKRTSWVHVLMKVTRRWPRSTCPWRTDQVLRWGRLQCLTSLKLLQMHARLQIHQQRSGNGPLRCMCPWKWQDAGLAELYPNAPEGIPNGEEISFKCSCHGLGASAALRKRTQVFRWEAPVPNVTFWKEKKLASNAEARSRTSCVHVTTRAFLCSSLAWIRG